MVDSVQSGGPVRSGMFTRSPFASSNTSPPTPAFRSDIFGQSSAAGSPQFHGGTSPVAERHPTDRKGTMPALSASTSDPLAFGADSRIPSAVLIRKLPHDMGINTLRTLFLFSNDLIDIEFVHAHHAEDRGFMSAVARFRTSAGALEAISKLNGKPNTTQEANMVVEPYTGSPVSAFDRRNTIDGTASRNQTSSASSAGSMGPHSGRSRFNSAFQPPEKISPPLPTPTSGSNGEHHMSGSTQHFHKLFSPQSPLANGMDGHHRVSGKSMINDDSVDDETGELLKDPVAYAKSGQQAMARRATNPQIPVGRFASLSLSTPNGMNNGMVHSGYNSPRGHSTQQTTSPAAQSHASAANANANATYLPNFSRHMYPPANPADQNPPCNTLYVGNLPIDTDEDELKNLFSKQRGYKRLCFRTKHNGPMCFVEFEDVSMATRCLNELYGHVLHNSVKGGIRLSFSKNPLGVRSGQSGGLTPNPVMSPQAVSPGYAGVVNHGNFSSVSGPPPGLEASSNFLNGVNYRQPPQGAMVPTGMDSMFSNPFQVQHPVNQSNTAHPRQFSGGVPPIMGNGTYGRDSRKGQPRQDFPDTRNNYHDSSSGYGDPRMGYHNLPNGYADPRNGFTSYDYSSG